MADAGGFLDWGEAMQRGWAREGPASGAFRGDLPRARVRTRTGFTMHFSRRKKKDDREINKEKRSADKYLKLCGLINDQ
jgi:hypothetical protein